MKKGVVLILVIAVIVGLVFMFRGASTRGPASSNLAQRISEKTEADAVFQSLPADILAVAQYRRDNAKGFIDTFDEWYNRVAATAVWKKFNPVEMFWASIEQQSQAGGGGPALKEVLERTRDTLTRLDSALFLVSERTFQAMPEKEVPPFSIRLNFTDESPVIAWRKELEKQFEENKELLAAGPADIQKTANGFEVHGRKMEGMPEVKARGELAFNGRTIQLSFRSEDVDPFVLASGEPTIASSDTFKRVAAGAAKGAAFVTYARPRAATELVKKLAISWGGVEESEVSAALDPSLRAWADMEALSSAITTNTGYRSFGCVAVVPDSRSAKFYESWGASAGQGDSNFPRLVGERTIFAGRLRGGTILPYVKLLRDQFADMGKASDPTGLGAPFQDKMTSALDGVIAAFDGVELTEVGATIDAPAGVPIPGGALYVAQAGVAGKDALASVSKLASSIVTALEGGTDSGVKFRMAAGSDGNQNLQVLTEGEQPKAIGIAGENGGVVFALDQLAVKDAEAKLKSSNSRIEEASWKNGEVIRDIKSSDLYVYVNSEPAFNAARPFVPMITSGPQAPATAAEVEELMDLFSGKALFVQRAMPAGENTLCAEQLLSRAKS